jgi:hypothetical protein
MIGPATGTLGAAKIKSIIAGKLAKSGVAAFPFL